MSDTTIAEVPVWVCPEDGPTMRSEADAVDVIGQTYGSEAELIVIPVGRLGADFFTLRTRVAGEMLQKFVNYRLRVAIVGDIAEHVESSSALADFVRESNRGNQVWFAASREELESRLGPGDGNPRGTVHLTARSSEAQ